MDRTLQGRRCRTARPIRHHAGFIPRESGGTVRYAMENMGRLLVRVDLDSGRSLTVLAEDLIVEGAKMSAREQHDHGPEGRR